VESAEGKFSEKGLAGRVQQKKKGRKGTDGNRRKKKGGEEGGVCVEWWALKMTSGHLGLREGLPAIIQCLSGFQDLVREQKSSETLVSDQDTIRHNDTTTQKTTNSIFTAVKASNLASLNLIMLI
jgi:hypothetical protein